MSADWHGSALKGSRSVVVATLASNSSVSSSPTSTTSDPPLTPTSAAQHPGCTDTLDRTLRGNPTTFVAPRTPSSSSSCSSSSSSSHQTPRVLLPNESLPPLAPPMHHHPMLLDRSSQFSLASPSSSSSSASAFFSHLPRPQTTTYGPHAGMNHVVQRPYLPLSESYTQSLIQIGHLPHLIRPSMQYPAYLNPLTIGRDGVGSSGVANRGLLPLAQMIPMAAHRRMSNAADPFQRSPRPDSRTTSWTNRMRNSPMHQPYKEHHRSPNGHSPVHGGRCGGGVSGQWPGALLSSPKPTVTRKSPAGEEQGNAAGSMGALKDHGDWGVAATAECKILPAVKQMIPGEMGSPAARCQAQMSSYLHLPSSSSLGMTHSAAYPVTPSSSTVTAAVPAVVPVQDQPHYPPHFMRGSIIQLGTGQLKPVEDLLTKDFVDSADVNADLRIDSSTVVHMRQNHERNTVILGFAVGKQNIQVTVEATLEHPFFVYNQGWSSYCPERTLVRYGLHCRQLMVGNSCISLTHRGGDPRLPGLPHASSTARVNPTKPEPGEIVPRSDEPCRKMPRRESVVKAYSAAAEGTPAADLAWLREGPPKDETSGKSPQSVNAAGDRSTPAGVGTGGQSPSRCGVGKRRRWSASDAKVPCDEEEEELVPGKGGAVAGKSRPVAVAITMKGSVVDEALGSGGRGMMAPTVNDG